MISTLIFLALLAAQINDAASVARIKAALEKPAPKLNLDVPKADFRINVDAIRPFADLFELPPWVTPPTGYDAPKTNRDPHDGTVVGVGFDPGAVAHSIAEGVRERRSHKEVMEAIMQYCAAHRDEPGAAGICGGPPR